MIALQLDRAGRRGTFRQLVGLQGRPISLRRDGSGPSFSSSLSLSLCLILIFNDFLQLSICHLIVEWIFHIAADHTQEATMVEGNEIMMTVITLTGTTKDDDIA